jgi:hypothetical protein
MSEYLLYGIFFMILTILFYISNKYWEKDRKNKNDNSETFKIVTLGGSVKKKMILVILIFTTIFCLLKAIN